MLIWISFYRRLLSKYIKDIPKSKVMGIKLNIFHYTLIELGNSLHHSICTECPHLVILHRITTIMRFHQDRQRRVIINLKTLVIDYVSITFELCLFGLIIWKLKLITKFARKCCSVLAPKTSFENVFKSSRNISLDLLCFRTLILWHDVVEALVVFD